MIDIDVAYDKLAGFESADDIACFFRGYGLKALPKSVNRCAISAWLAEMTGEDPGQIFVSGGGILVGCAPGGTAWNNYGYLAQTARWMRPLTSAMHEFIRKFDQLEYRDLIADEFRPGNWVYDATMGAESVMLVAEKFEIQKIESDTANKYGFSLFATYKAKLEAGQISLHFLET